MSLAYNKKQSTTKTKKWCTCDTCLPSRDTPRGKLLAERTWRSHQQAQKVKDEIKRVATEAVAAAIAAAPLPPPPRPSPAPLPSFHTLPIADNSLFECEFQSNDQADWFVQDEVERVAHSGQ
jgi:hypothetical protein